MARAIRKQRIVESDPEEDESESDEEDEDESEVNEDERPTRRKGRASTGQTSTYSRKGAAPAAKGRLKGKAPAIRQTLTKSSGAGGKGKRRAAVSDDDGEGEEGDEADGDVLEVEEADDGEVDGDEGVGGQKGKQTREIAGPDLSRYAQQVVRLALFAEGSQGTLKREDINKKILGKDTRAFGDVLALARRILRKTFALELVEVRPRGKGVGGAEDVAAEADKARSLAAAASQKARSKGKGKGKTKGGPKKRRRGGDASESEEDESQGEDEEGTTVHGRVSTRKKASGPARAFILRSLLPLDLVQAIAVPSPPQDPATAFGQGVVESGPILDFDREGGMALLGVLYIVLALILINGRRLPDDHLKAYLKQLDLHPSTRLPAAQTTTGGQPLTVEGFLTACVRNGYLERAKAAKGVFGSSSSQAPPLAAGSGLNGGGGGGGRRGRGREKEGGEEDLVWGWGARAEIEISEKGLTELVGDLYLGGGVDEPAAEDGEETLAREEREKRLTKRRKERERLRIDVRRAAGGELQGDVDEPVFGQPQQQRLEPAVG